ncbi:hypothetical protein J6X09_00120 [Candidatus Saccharibacteria bacterium]|nr:hypothetical protein [Candidatus Saccharibacteria bacterium]
MIKAEAVLVLGENVKKLKNKKYLPLIAIVALVAVAGIGAVIAFGSDRAMFNNNFAVADYKTVAEENFSSPDDWTPCTETPKVATMTNNGNVPVVVRMKIEEWWRDAADTQDLPLVKDGVTLAEIKTQNESDWELKGDGWYYYKELLAPGQTTTSLLKSVKLDCSANFGGENVCTDTAEGKVCEKPADAYENAKYHLKVTFQTAQEGASSNEPSRALATIVCDRVVDPTFQIDFTKKAIQSDDLTTANGNGVNGYIENGQEVCYFRGAVDDNNVIWADLCWMIIRTTATGGTKMIYNGEPTEVDGVRQCLATGKDVGIKVDTTSDWTYPPTEVNSSPSDMGYMYGERVEDVGVYPGQNIVTLSNNVSRNGDTYTLDMNEGQYITGAWTSIVSEAVTRYHYFCTDGATSCDSSKIAYNYVKGNNGALYYLNIGGHDDIEAAKAAWFANTNNSKVKVAVETWFEQKNLDGHIDGTRNYEDDLEDAIYCNDRTFTSGALVGKDSDGTGATRWGAYTRNYVKNSLNNYAPSLDCPNKNDAFTKDDTTNGNGKLEHKIGLITMDELTLAGTNVTDVASTNYIYSHYNLWTGSPSFYSYQGGYVFSWSEKAGNSQTYNRRMISPVVSLKAGTEYASGEGTKTNPYIVE